jgi:glutathione synthase
LKTIAFVIDPIDKISVSKDTTLALAQAAFSLGCRVCFIQASDMWQSKQGVFAKAYQITSIDERVQGVLEKSIKLDDVLTLAEPVAVGASDLDIVLMRKDPPFDHGFLILTQLLSQWQQGGVRIINPPESLRALNEKRFIFEFPDDIADTILTSHVEQLLAFIQKHKQVILKPLDSMGGDGIRQVSAEESGLEVSLKQLTAHQTIPWMAQQQLDVHKEGDKRILILNGEVVPFALARFPKQGGYLANLAAGGHGKVVPLTDRDCELANSVRAYGQSRDISIIGTDVIDGHITEVNITSPTCLREIQAVSDQCYALQFMQSLVTKVN